MLDRFAIRLIAPLLTPVARQLVQRGVTADQITLAGFAIGNLVAVAMGMLFAWYRPAARLMAGVNVTLFAMPAIALVPILVIALPGDAPRVVLAALSVYYPTMVATVASACSCALGCPQSGSCLAITSTISLIRRVAARRTSGA